jgi:hypothetical protein
MFDAALARPNQAGSPASPAAHAAKRRCSAESPRGLSFRQAGGVGDERTIKYFFRAR